MVAFSSDLDSASRFVTMARQVWEKQRAQRAARDLSRDMGAEAHRGGHLAPEVARYWDDAQAVFDSGRVVRGTVTGWNRGGLLVRWEHLQGFVPASQMSDVSILGEDDDREGKLACWMGRDLDLKIIELDRGRNRLVFSERATRWGPRDGDRVLAEVQEAEVCQGTVSNLCDFGAFVDLGGIDGLVHLSELSWRRVNHPSDVLSIGQEVDVLVIGVDRERRRIALSVKQLKANPWEKVDERYQIDQVIQAQVTNVVDFGVFAQIEEGLEGLVHVSEMPELGEARPGEVVSVGERIQVRIIRIDSENQRLGLSMRDFSEPPEGDAVDPDLDGDPTFLY